VDIFREVVLALGVGWYAIAYDAKLVRLIAKEFAVRTSQIVPPSELVGKITALRRRGLLPKTGDLPKETREDGIRFADIDDVPM